MCERGVRGSLLPAVLLVSALRAWRLGADGRAENIDA